MKLEDITRVSILARLLNEAKMQLDTLKSKKFKETITVTMYEDGARDLPPVTFNIRFDEALHKSLVRSMEERIERLENDIIDCGVEL